MRSNLTPQDPAAQPPPGTTFVPKVHGFPNPNQEMAAHYLGTTQKQSEPVVGNRRCDEEHVKDFNDGKLPSDDAYRISCSVQFWKPWVSEENQLWTKLFIETKFFLDNEIIGGHIKRNDATLIMKSGGFILMTTPDAANRMIQWLCSTPFPQPVTGVDHYPQARIADRGVRIKYENPYDRNCIKHLWLPRKASLLAETPQILHQIDVGEAVHGVSSGQCMACHQFGHQRKDCPAINQYIAKYHSDYACYHCGAVNHHLTDKCVHHPPNVAGGKMIAYPKGDKQFQ